MTTLASSKVEPADDSTIEKQIYSIVDRYKEFLPVDNDRYRLAYTLVKFINGEGDAPEIAVKTNKLTFNGITAKELAEKLTEDLQSVKNPND
jgi:hypothetical protein